MTYLVDANVFLQAKNTHYGLDFCPAFWKWLTDSGLAGDVASIERVRDELQDGDITLWVNAQPEAFFLAPDQAVADALVTLSAWAVGQHYTPAALAEFLASADYYLIGHALAYGHIVVTNEVPSNTPNRVKIPNACNGVGVNCVSPFKMLRDLHARFVLGPIHEPYEGANLAALPAVSAPAAVVTAPAPPVNGATAPAP